MSPDGVVSWGDDLSRSMGGAMEKVKDGSYSLKLFSARPLDSGVYRCVVSVYAGRRNPGPSTPATLTQRSEGVVVNLKTKGERLSYISGSGVQSGIGQFKDKMSGTQTTGLTNGYKTEQS